MTDMVTNRVDKLRSKADMTQADLAKAVGVTRQTIIAIEKGNYTPSVLLALIISIFFKKSVEDIFSIC